MSWLWLYCLLLGIVLFKHYKKVLLHEFLSLFKGMRVLLLSKIITRRCKHTVTETK